MQAVFAVFGINSDGLNLAINLLILFLVIIWFALHSLQPPWSFVVAAIGLVPIAAGLFNFCLLGPLFSVDLLGRPRTNSAP